MTQPILSSEDAPNTFRSAATAVPKFTMAQGAHRSKPYPEKSFPPALEPPGLLPVPKPLRFLPLQSPASTRPFLSTWIAEIVQPLRLLFSSKARPPSTSTPTALPPSFTVFPFRVAPALAPLTITPTAAPLSQLSPSTVTCAVLVGVVGDCHARIPLPVPAMRTVAPITVKKVFTATGHSGGHSASVVLKT